ncbi:MAG: AAA family ATPase [Emergencia sp.]
MNERIIEIKKEIGKAITGKDQVVEKVLVAILAGGHILLEDIPGVGKTTLALACTKSMGLDFKRVQFTPDVVPSDITGFTIYDKNKGQFDYNPGAVMCNFFLADEINRTSSKTQSALLEVMQEGKVTVDGQTHVVPKPFVVMATQNPIGTIGTQMLPEAQLDRFMIQLSMGYPGFDEQVEILLNRDREDPLNTIHQVIDAEGLETIIGEVKAIFVDKKIYEYITALTEATRESEYIKLGVSPRGALALAAIVKAEAYLQGRDYVVPEDVDKLFVDVCRHRLILHPKAQLAEKSAVTLLKEILSCTAAPKLNR